MVVIKISGNKTRVFTDIVSTLSGFISDINLYISKDAVYSQTIDKNKVSLCEFVLAKEWFESYVFEEDTQLVLGVNFTILEKILKCRHTSQSIILTYETDGDYLCIDFADGSSFDKSFEIPIYDVEYSEMKLPTDAEWDATLRFNSSDFNKLMSEASMFSETVRFVCNDTSVALEARSDTGSYKVEIPEDKLLEYSIFEGENVDIMYALSYLVTISSFSRIHFEEAIELSDKLPLRATYNLDNIIKKSKPAKSNEVELEEAVGIVEEGDEEVEEYEYEEVQPTNYIRFYLAPKYDS